MAMTVVNVTDLEPTAPSDHVTVTVSVFIVGVMAGVGVTVSARVKVTGPWVTLTLPDRQVLEPAPALVKPTRRLRDRRSGRHVSAPQVAADHTRRENGRSHQSDRKQHDRDKNFDQSETILVTNNFRRR